MAESKRMKNICEKSRSNELYDALNAFKLLKEISTVKFLESVDVSVTLGIDPKKSDQGVRGSTVLPKGTGREVKVAVIAQGANADAAKEAGADIVGFDDLAETIKAGNFNFDVLIATPDAMPLVGKLGPILGPRGLMPNPKVGTVTNEVANAVNNAKSGQVRYKTDKAGLVHCRIGTVKFAEKDLKENLEALIVDLKKAKPVSSKGVYLKKISVSTTMGPGVVVDQASLSI